MNKVFAEVTEYKLLEPLPGVQSRAGYTNANTYISGLFELLVSMAIALAVLRLIYAGIIYMSTDAFSQKSEAKGIITETFWGLGFVLGAWVIVATVLSGSPNLQGNAFNFSLGLPPIPGNPNTNPPGGGSAAPSNLTQNQILDQLRIAQIGVRGPIQLAGLQQGTINEIISLKGQCGCDVTITSATGGVHESGTYSHANGYKVDLGLNNSLTSYITSHYTHLPDRSDGAKMYRAPSGNLYALESNHWDVAVTR